MSMKEIQTQQRIGPRLEGETGAKNGVLQNYIRAEHLDEEEEAMLTRKTTLGCKRTAERSFS